MKVVNLFGGPGSGKSTRAAELFAYAKKQGENVELVTEYAKDMVWEDRANILDDQLYILGKQNRRLHRLRGAVDYVITDSPLLLGAYYARANYFRTFRALAIEVFESYDNINVFLLRPPRETYRKVGRLQDYQSAVDIDLRLRAFLQGIHWHASVTPTDTNNNVWQLVKTGEWK